MEAIEHWPKASGQSAAGLPNSTVRHAHEPACQAEARFNGSSGAMDNLQQLLGCFARLRLSLHGWATIFIHPSQQLTL
jgi:hypothetical protein